VTPDTLPGLTTLLYWRARLWWLRWRLNRTVRAQVRIVEGLKVVRDKVKALDPEAK